jgi:hypothetical protein
VNIGVLLGEPSAGLIDVDIDAAGAIRLARKYLPETGLIHGRAGKSRSHYWYIANPIPSPVKFSDPDGTTLIELRSTGQQTLAPPSRHPSGESLIWQAVNDPAQVDGRTLRAQVAKVAACAMIARRWPAEGSRHDAALALSGFLIRGGLSAEQTARFVSRAAAVAGDPEWSDRKTCALDTAMRHGQGEPITGRRKLTAMFGEPVVTLLSQWLGLRNTPEADPWEIPVSFENFSLPSFPLSALPKPLAAHVGEVAATCQVRVDIPALLSFGVAGAAAARSGFRVQIGDTHQEPLNVYIAVSAGPGERKTPALRETIFPLEEAEQELIGAASPLIAAARERRAVEEARLRDLRSRAAKAPGGEDRDRLATEAEEVALAMTPIPPAPALLTDDITPERLVMAMADQGGCIALASEEGSGILEIAAGRYSKNGEPQLEVFLKAHDGGSIRVDRVGRPSVLVPRPALTMLLPVQPSVLRKFRKRPEFRERGFIGRFLFALPETMVGMRPYSNRPMDRQARAEYGNAIRRILEYAGDPDHAAPALLRIEGEALKAWAEHANRVEDEQRDGGRLSGVRDWASKLAGQVARIAGIIHLIEHPVPRPSSIPISVQTVLAAWTIGDYLISHALAAYSMMGAEERVLIAHHVLRWITRNQVSEFSLRGCHQHNRGFTKSEDLLPGIEVLVERGYVRPKTAMPRSGPGRPPSALFQVNPYVLNSQNSRNVV